jgi:hypothetical protein
MCWAGGLSFLIWTFIPIKAIAIILIVPVAALFLALAFVRFNNRPFADLLESAFAYYTGPKIFTWKQPIPKTTGNEAKIDQIVADTTKEVIISKTNKDRLHDLALGLDVLDTNPQKDRPL